MILMECGVDDVTKNFGHFFQSFVFSQFVQKCNKNVLPIETHCQTGTGGVMMSSFYF